MQETEILDPKQAKQYSPLSLAFLGDAVYEQLVRERLILVANMPVRRLHTLTVGYVRAAYQSRASELIEPLLTEEEGDIFRRGRNCNNSTVPKNCDVVEYRRATALEALFGYLYLTGQKERVAQLFESIWAMGQSGNAKEGYANAKDCQS